jgi:Na+/proline symporter
MGGALFSLLFILARVDGGLGEAVRVAADGRHFFETVDWSRDLTVASGWVILIGSLFHNLLPYTASQDVVQRYVTTPDQQTAARGIWLNALVSVPAQGLFFCIGTALFVFYKQQPAQLEVTLQNDAIFPFFIMSQLPVGVAGLVVAGIFAAAQSTLASSLNSIATAYVTDFHHRLRPAASDQDCLRVARWATMLVGVAGTVAALVMASTDIRTVYLARARVHGAARRNAVGLVRAGHLQPPSVRQWCARGGRAECGDRLLRAADSPVERICLCAPRTDFVRCDGMADQLARARGTGKD